MKRFLRSHALRSALALIGLVVGSVFATGGPAGATPTPVGLGTATPFAIRAGSGIMNTNAGTLITGNIGNAPGAGSQITGLTCTPPQVVGTIYQVSAGGPTPCTVTDPSLMTTVQSDAMTAFNHTSALPGATPTVTNLSSLSPLVAGLYSFGHDPTANIQGTLTLDAQGDPNSVWIFQASSDLVTAPGSAVQFTNLPPGVLPAQMACNVFWTVGSSATIDTTSAFVGTVLASASITVNNGATIIGRLLAGNAAGAGGAVTLINDTITTPTGCPTLAAGTGGGPATPAGSGGATGATVLTPAFTG